MIRKRQSEVPVYILFFPSRLKFRPREIKVLPADNCCPLGPFFIKPPSLVLYSLRKKPHSPKNEELSFLWETQFYFSSQKFMKCCFFSRFSLLLLTWQMKVDFYSGFNLRRQFFEGAQEIDRYLKGPQTLACRESCWLLYLSPSRTMLFSGFPRLLNHQNGAQSISSCGLWLCQREWEPCFMSQKRAISK